MRITLTLLTGTFVSMASALGQWDAPFDYYENAEGLTGDDLKAALHEIIDDHTLIPYSSSTTDTRDALMEMFEDPNNENNLILVYSGDSIPKVNTSEWNREHLWPQSYGVDNVPGRSDLFNLRPSDMDVNSARGSRVYDNVTSGSSHAEAPQSMFDSTFWEPRDEEKGDIARAMFYMAVRYEGGESTPNLELSDTPNSGTYEFGMLSTLLQWHQMDAVNDHEKEVNHIVYTSYQGNRNPFVDHPEWVEVIWGSEPSLSLSISKSNFMENEGSEAAEVTLTRSNNFGTLTVSLSLDDSTEATLPQEVTFLDSEETATLWITAIDDGIEDGDQIVTLTVSALNYTSATLSFTVQDSYEEETTQGAASDLFISEYIEGSSLNKSIEIYNGTGATINLSNYSLELYTNGSSTASQTLQLSGSLAHNDVLVISNSGANSSILEATDTTHGVASFNGDDVIVLSHSGSAIDVIGGPIGQRSEWAKDVTLIRNANLSSGNTTFDLSEWTALAKDNTENLGTHTVEAITEETPTTFIPKSWAYWENYPWIFNNGTWYYLLAVESKVYLYNYDTDKWLPMGN